jgi:rhodanese-related sulfurtransferase
MSSWFQHLLGAVRASVSAVPEADLELLQRIGDLYATARVGFVGVPEIGADEALALVGDPGWLIVDVRPSVERAVSTLPGALDLDTFRAAGPMGKRVLCYCTIGARSGRVAKQLRAEGVDAHNLAGSLLAWSHVDGPVERNRLRVREVHVYGKQWNLVKTGWRGVW